MSWRHNAEKVLKILDRETGDEEGWVLMNDHLEKVGLKNPADIRWAFHVLASKDSKWAETEKPLDGKDFAEWVLAEKKFRVKPGFKIRARLTGLGAQELLIRRNRRHPHDRWTRWATIITALATTATVVLGVIWRSADRAEKTMNQGRTEQPAPEPNSASTIHSTSVEGPTSTTSAAPNFRPDSTSGHRAIQVADSSSHAPVEKRK